MNKLNAIHCGNAGNNHNNARNIELVVFAWEKIKNKKKNKIYSRN